MISDDYQKLLGEVAHLKRMVGGMFRPAALKSIGGPNGKDGDKVRAVLGTDKDGKEVLGPWINTANHRGGSRERRFFKDGGEGEGQNVMLCCPGGDVSQAFVIAQAPNKKNKPPDHANTSGKDEEVYQFDDLRSKQTKDGYAIWFQDPEQDDQQQQGQQGGGGGHLYQQGEQDEAPERQPQKPKADDVAMHANKGKSWTARFGDKKRVMVSAKGTMMKVDKDFALINEKGKLIVSKPWEIGKEIETDDRLAGDDQQSA